MNSLLVYFRECKEPAQRLASTTGMASAEIVVHRFPDGESLVTLPEPLPECVVVYRSLDRPNGKLVELMLAAQGARSRGVDRLVLVAPYLAYMRQDKSFAPGQVVSQKVIGSFLAGLFDALITIDAHLHRVKSLKEVVSECTAVNLTSAELASDYIRRYFQADAFLLGPDQESEQWVSAIAGGAGLEYGICTKLRRGDERVEVRLPDVNFKGRQVVLIDDIVSTGHTLAEAAAHVLRAGAGRIDCIVTHALFVRGAMKLLRSRGINRIISTDTVPHSTNRIHTAPVVAKALRDLV